MSYAVGVAVRTRIGSWSFEKLENTVLKSIPGYEIINNLLRGFAEKRTSYPAALVQLHGPGSAVLGFVVDTHDGGDLTVFVPMAPTITMGTVHVVSPECVTILEDAAIGLTQSISQWGIGSGKIEGIRVPRARESSGP